MTSRWRSEEGAATIFVVGIAASLLMLAGLLYDGGRILTARQQAFANADNAARAAAQAVDLDALRSDGAPALDPVAAESAAREYLAAHGLDGDVEVTGDRVDVEVRLDVAMSLLSAIGLDTRTVVGTGSARLVEGVSRGES